jgi:hypothetical protein
MEVTLIKERETRNMVVYSNKDEIAFDKIALDKNWLMNTYGRYPTTLNWEIVDKDW